MNKTKTIPSPISPSGQRALNFLASLPGGSDTVTREELRSVLYHTGGNMMARGRLYGFHIEYLGAGIYRLSLKERS
jgi:hypothetical protein